MSTTLIAAAISGIVLGSTNISTAHASAQTASTRSSDAQQLDDKSGAKHACRGQNECKGQGGCKTDKHACKGQNECKGQGGCKH